RPPAPRERRSRSRSSCLLLETRDVPIVTPDRGSVLLHPRRRQHGLGAQGVERGLAAVHLQGAFEAEDGTALDLVLGLVIGARPLVPGALAARAAQARVAGEDLHHPFAILQEIG